MRKLLLVSLITIITSSSVFAQSAYVGQGNSAYGFFAGYSSGSNVDAVGAGFGYGFNGLIDIKYQYSDVSMKLRRGTDNQMVHSLGLTIFPLNIQSIPLKISLNTEVSIYEHYTGYSFAPVFHLDTRLSKSAFLKLYSGVGYANISGSYKSDNLLTQFGFSIFTNKDNKNMFVIDVGYAHFNHESSIGISLGLFFGSQKNSPLPKYESKQQPNDKKKKKRGSYYGS